MRLPTKEEFDAVRFALWSVFEIVLMLIAMVAVIVVSLKHIPTKAKAKHKTSSKGQSSLGVPFAD